MSLNETDQIIEMMQQKHEVLTHLLKTVTQQNYFIDNGDWTQLMTVLSGKQRLLAKLQETESNLDPFRQQNPETRVWRSDADRNRCVILAAQSAQLLAKVVKLEQAGESNLSQKRDQAASQLQGVHVAAEAAGAYQQMTNAPISQFNAVD